MNFILSDALDQGVSSDLSDYLRFLVTLPPDDISALVSLLSLHLEPDLPSRISLSSPYCSEASLITSYRGNLRYLYLRCMVNGVSYKQYVCPLRSFDFSRLESAASRLSGRIDSRFS